MVKPASDVDFEGGRARSGLGWALIEVTVDTEVASAGANGVVILLCISETLGIARCLAFPRFYFLLGFILALRPSVVVGQ